MQKISGITWVLSALSLLIWGILAPATGRGTPAERRGLIMPFFDARAHQTRYVGPGREKAPPTDVNEVRIGYFGPSTDSHPEGGDMWRAACLAIDQANQAGGYKGVPLRLVAAWSENPWGSGVTQVTRMVYVDNVWAIIGGIDGPSTHLAEQVVAKARLTLLSPACTDRTANLANVPWMFSCLPPDNVQAPVLARAIASCVGRRPFVLVSAVDHDSHIFAVELMKSLARHRLAPAHHFEFDARQGEFTELVGEILNAEAHALVVVAGAQPSAHIIRAVRERGFSKPIFGGPCMGRRTFVEQAGKAAEGVVFPLLYTSSTGSCHPERSRGVWLQVQGGQRPGPDKKRYAEHTLRAAPGTEPALSLPKGAGANPDYLAAHTYDAVNLLVEAIHRAGLNRARIGDAVRELSPWRGVTGNIRWDSLGSNSRGVGLGTIRDGRVLPVSQK